MATTTDPTKTAQKRASAKHMFVQTVHGVRYQVKDVARSVAFYTTHLGFTLEHQQLPAFASVSLGDAQILLSGPQASGSRPMPDGQRQEPGGWNRVVLRVTRSSRVHRDPEESGPPFPERHGDRAWRQANPGRGSRRQSHRVVRARRIATSIEVPGTAAARTPTDSPAERGRLSQHGGRPFSDDDARDFENGYWHLEQLKNFAQRIGMHLGPRRGVEVRF